MSTCFSKKIGSLINSLRGKNSHEKLNCEKRIHKQVAQLRVKTVKPHRDQMLRLWAVACVIFRLVVC